MITTVEGQTVWTFTEPTLEQITSGDYTLPVNFKVVDVETSTYKIVSFVYDSENGARRLELGSENLSNSTKIPNYTLGEILQKNEVRYYEVGSVKGIWRSKIDNNNTAPFLLKEYVVENLKFVHFDENYNVDSEILVGDNVVFINENIQIYYLFENVNINFQIGDSVLQFFNDVPATVEVVTYEQLITLISNSGFSCSEFVTQTPILYRLYNGKLYYINCPIEEFLTISNWELIADLTGNSSNNQTGDYIPLTGTEVGKPITGFIELSNNDNPVILYSGNMTTGVWKGIRTWKDDGSFEIVSSRGALGEDSVLMGTDVGLSGSKDFSEIEPTNKLIYAQRGYVDKSNSYSSREEIKTGGYFEHYKAGVGYVKKPIYRKVINQYIENNTFSMIIPDFEKLSKPLEGLQSLKRIPYCESSVAVNTLIISTVNINYAGDGEFEITQNVSSTSLIDNTTTYSNEDLGDITIIVEYTKTTDPEIVTEPENRF